MKKKTIIERNAEYARTRVDRGETIYISARYGRSDHNGGHVRAIADNGDLLGRSSGGGYDLRCAAMWQAVQGVLSVPTHQLTGYGSDEFGLIYANFGPRWEAFFRQYGYNVKTRESYNTNGHALDYICEISKMEIK